MTVPALDILTTLSQELERVRDRLPAGAIEREHVDLQLVAVRRISAQIQADRPQSARMIRECRETIDRAFASLAAAYKRLEWGDTRLKSPVSALSPQTGAGSALSSGMDRPSAIPAEEEKLAKTSSEILDDVRELRRLEEAKRTVPIASGRFRELADAIVRKSRQIMQRTTVEDDLGRELDSDGRSINEILDGRQ